MKIPLSEIGPNGLLTLGQAARLCDMSAPSLNYWVRLGELQISEQTGAGPMFRRYEVEAFLKFRIADKEEKAKRAAAKKALRYSSLPPSKRFAVG